MKDIKQIQEENRKAIICAVRETHDYEEALEKLAEEVLLDESDGPTGYGQWITVRKDEFMKKVVIMKSYPDINDDFVENEYLMSADEFAARQLTLDRVLLVLINVKIYGESAKFLVNSGKIAFEEYDEDGCHHVFMEADWDLTKPTLEEQSEETQRAINELLIKYEI